MSFGNASRGIGTGIGIIGMGIGLKFMKDITDDFKTRNHKKYYQYYQSPSFPKIKPYKFKKWRY